MGHVMNRYMISDFRTVLFDDEKSEATIEKYLRDLDRFYSFANGMEITKEIAIRYKQSLIECYAPASVNSMLAAINRFFKEQGWYDCIVKSVKIQRQSFRDKEKELTKEEYYRLLQTALAQKNTRLYLLMQTICATGIRVSEVQFITVEAIGKGHATVTLKGKTRQVHLPAELRRQLQLFAKERGIASGCIFITRGGKPLDRSNILHEMKKLCVAVGIEHGKVFPHNLRHLFACTFYEETKDLSRLSDVLGHSNINTTRIYTCVSASAYVKQLESLGLIVQITA